MKIKMGEVLKLHNFLFSELSCCVTSIYAAWHIGIASSSNFVASSSVGGGVCHTLYSGDSISKMARQILHVYVSGHR